MQRPLFPVMPGDDYIICGAICGNFPTRSWHAGRQIVNIFRRTVMMKHLLKVANNHHRLTTTVLKLHHKCKQVDGNDWIAFSCDSSLARGPGLAVVACSFAGSSPESVASKTSQRVIFLPSKNGLVKSTNISVDICPSSIKVKSWPTYWLINQENCFNP